MRSGLLLALLLLFAAPVWAAEEPQFKGDNRDFAWRDAPSPAPLAEFHDAEGAALSLADFRGKVVLLNFWGSWCAPCIGELPSLDALQADLGSEEFTVLTLAIDNKDTPYLVAFLQELGIENLAFHRLGDPQEAFAAFRLGGMPTTLLIDREGRIIGSILGAADWNGDEAKAVIRRALEN